MSYQTSYRYTTEVLSQTLTVEASEKHSDIVLRANLDQVQFEILLKAHEIDVLIEMLTDAKKDLEVKE